MDKVTAAKILIELDKAADILQGMASGPSDPLAYALRKVNVAARTIRRDYEDIESLIRECCKRGLSKNEAMQALRISRYRFALLVEAMPELKWVNGNCVARQRYNESLKGIPATPERRAALERGRAKMINNQRRHRLCGVQGTLRELYDMWYDYVSVSYQTVGGRLRAGQSLYDALFMPRQPSAVDKCAKTNAHRAKLSASRVSTFSHRQRIANATSQQETRP